MAGSAYTIYYDNVAPEAQTLSVTTNMALAAGNPYAVVDTQPSGGPQYITAGVGYLNFTFTFGSSVAVRHLGVAGLQNLYVGSIKLSYFDGAGSYIGVGTLNAASLQPGNIGMPQCGVSEAMTNVGYKTTWRVEFYSPFPSTFRIGEVYLFLRDAYAITPEYQTRRLYKPLRGLTESLGGQAYSRSYGSVVMYDELHYANRTGAGNAAIGLVQVLTHPRGHAGMIVDAAALYPQSALNTSSTGLPLPYDLEAYSTSGNNDGTVYPVRFWEENGYDVTYTTYGQFAFSNVLLRMDPQG